MSKKTTNNLPERALNRVTKFFLELETTDRELIPSVLKSHGKWIVTHDESILAIFYLNRAEQRRVREHQRKNWPLFPGFMVSKAKRPPSASVAIALDGERVFLSSNHTSNLFVLEVAPGTSVTVADHFHEISDSTGREFRYHVPLAFVVGLSPGEQWPAVKPRLSGLLNHSMSIWRTLR